MSDRSGAKILKRIRLWLLGFFPEYQDALCRIAMVEAIAMQYNVNGYGMSETKRGLFYALNEALRESLPMGVTFDVLEKRDDSLKPGTVRVEVFVR